MDRLACAGEVVKINSESSHISISDSVRLRKEHFGGIVFDKNTGTTVDVDREGYKLLCLIKELGIVDANHLPKLQKEHSQVRLIKSDLVYSVIEKLLELGVLKVMPQGVLSENYADELDIWGKTKIRWPLPPDISAPETVHWAVTFQCDSNCLDCYIQRHKSQFSTELSTKQAFAVIDKIADAGVFQLAIGGGEPFMRQDIGDIIEKASERGLVVHVTTGRYQHQHDVLRAISNYVKSIQTGIRHQELVDNTKKEQEELAELVNHLREQDVIVGANLIVSNSSIREFNRIIEALSLAGFKRITLLRYKPPSRIRQWMQEKPDEEMLWKFEQQLPRTLATYPHITFRFDCGLAFLQRDLPPQAALYSGIRGCVAADRIVSIAPDGSVFPCSQLVGATFYAGNLMEDDFKSIWTGSKVLRKYRNFRFGKPLKASQCSQCAAKMHCGGCRVFAEDAIGGDVGCPDGAKNLSSVISDIQQSIGCTNAGFPYATVEQIKGWLDEDSYRDYPPWLLKDSHFEILK